MTKEARAANPDDEGVEIELLQCLALDTEVLHVYNDLCDDDLVYEEANDDKEEEEEADDSAT